MSEKFDPELISAYLDDQLTSDERIQVQQLIESDSDAARLFQEFRQIRNDLASLPKQKLDAGFSDRVLEQIRNIDEIEVGTAGSSVALKVASSGAEQESAWMANPTNRRYLFAGLASVAALILIIFTINSRPAGGPTVAMDSKENPVKKLDTASQQKTQPAAEEISNDDETDGMLSPALAQEVEDAVTPANRSNSRRSDNADRDIAGSDFKKDAQNAADSATEGSARGAAKKSEVENGPEEKSAGRKKAKVESNDKQHALGMANGALPEAPSGAADNKKGGNSLSQNELQSKGLKKDTGQQMPENAENRQPGIANPVEMESQPLSAEEQIEILYVDLPEKEFNSDLLKNALVKNQIKLKMADGRWQSREQDKFDNSVKPDASDESKSFQPENFKLFLVQAQPAQFDKLQLQLQQSNAARSKDQDPLIVGRRLVRLDETAIVNNDWPLDTEVDSYAIPANSESPSFRQLQGMHKYSRGRAARTNPDAISDGKMRSEGDEGDPDARKRAVDKLAMDPAGGGFGGGSGGGGLRGSADGGGRGNVGGQGNAPFGDSRENAATDRPAINKAAENQLAGKNNSKGKESTDADLGDDLDEKLKAQLEDPSGDKPESFWFDKDGNLKGKSRLEMADRDSESKPQDERIPRVEGDPAPLVQSAQSESLETEKQRIGAHFGLSGDLRRYLIVVRLQTESTQELSAESAKKAAAQESSNDDK